ncbi:unnamed protein product, partial [Phaeothamnion confervicola]
DDDDVAAAAAACHLGIYLHLLILFWVAYGEPNELATMADFGFAGFFEGVCFPISRSCPFVSTETAAFITRSQLRTCGSRLVITKLPPLAEMAGRLLRPSRLRPPPP